MLPPDRRVRRREDFTAALRHGRTARSAGLVMHLGKADKAVPARAGFVVGRVVGGAVARNQLRRRLQHVMAPRLGVLPAGTLVVVRATPGTAGRSSRDLATTLDTLFQRLLPQGQAAQ
jgi:ribonuclease P protein component